MNHPIPDSYWVSDGRLLAGEYPSSARDSAARTKLNALLDTGIRSFVDLTETEDPLAPYGELAKALGAERQVDVRHRRMAIRDLGIPTVDHMRAILAEAIHRGVVAGRNFLTGDVAALSRPPRTGRVGPKR